MQLLFKFFVIIQITVTDVESLCSSRTFPIFRVIMIYLDELILEKI